MGERAGGRWVQVVEVADASAVWSEASLMRHCSHERIVPLYGVASKVGGVAGGAGSGAREVPVAAHMLDDPKH